MKLKYLFPCLSLVLLLNGCAGTKNDVKQSFQSTGDSIQMLSNDQAIRRQIELTVKNDPAFDNSHIVAASYDGLVLLAGQTPNNNLRVKAGRIAASVPKVRRVYNQITINGVSSPLTRSSDAWITTKIKTDIITKLGSPAGNLKVVTENGTVFLMGHLTLRQEKLAISIARRTAGVLRVVKLIERAAAA